MDSAKLVIVRHGESIRNAVEKDYPEGAAHAYFHTEADRQKVGVLKDRWIPLSEEGWRQARETGKKLRESFGVFDWVVHSNYLRAEQTAKAILEAYGGTEQNQQAVMISHLIRERDAGFIHNMTREEVQKHFPWFDKYWQSEEMLFKVPPGGESVAQMCSGRLVLFLNELNRMLQSRNGGKVLLVSHGRTILGMRSLLEQWDYGKVNEKLGEHPPNCGVTYYRWGDALLGWWLVFENQVLY